MARTHQLSLGQSYGFDVVPTLDEPQTRRVSVRVIGPGGSQRYAESRGTQFLELQALNLPTAERLLRLARKVALDEQSQGLDPDAVRVQVWRTRYDSRTLQARPELIREVTLDLSSTSEAR